METITELYIQYSTGNPVYDVGVVLICTLGMGYVFLK